MHTDETLRIGIVADEIGGEAAIHREALHRPVAGAEIFELGRRSGVRVAVVDETDANDPLGPVKRQRLQQNAVDDAEDRRVGADA